MTVMADVFGFVERNAQLEEFNADMIARDTGQKSQTIAATLSVLKRSGRLIKGSKAGYYKPVKEEEMSEEERLEFQEKTEQLKQDAAKRRLEAAKEFAPVRKNSVSISVDDNVEVVMKREGGKTVYTFILK